MLLAFAHAAQVAAQPADYTYDLPGNTISATPGAAAAPTIIAQPTSQLLQSNGLVTFSVVASGSGLSYQWFSNGSTIAGATGDSLLLTGLTGTNFGNYTVSVSNSSGSVTSTPPVTIWPDSNANALPDWWELQHFGNLNQKPAADFDGDGVSNLDEYNEGTHPANNSAFNPRLTIQTAHGTVLATPNLAYYTNGQFVSLAAIPDPGWTFLTWSGDSAGDKTPVNVLMNTNKTVLARFGLSLPIALNHAVQWTTGGDAQWFGQAEISHDNVGAAQSGPIYAGTAGNFVGQQTWLQTVTNASQPITVSFWWAVSSQAPDALTFSVNGVVYSSISGETLNWQFFQTNLPPGNYALTWTYAKGPTDLPSGIPFQDSAWLDQVAIVPVGGLAQPPLLSIALTSSNSALLSWPTSSTAFLLQQNQNLSPANWTTSSLAVSVIGTNHQAVASTSNQLQFFRLKSQ